MDGANRLISSRGDDCHSPLGDRAEQRADASEESGAGDPRPNQVDGVCPGQGSLMASGVLSQQRQARRPSPQRQGWQVQPRSEECATRHGGSGDAAWARETP